MKAFSITDIGMKRHMNQDYVFASENAIGKFPNLFIVADGMGGHKAGDYASRVCVKTMIESVQNSTLKTYIGILEEAIGAANKRIFEDAASNNDLEGMGTTLVVAVVLEDNTLYVANIGDSRLYLVDEEEIRQITEDHSLVEEMVKNGELERSEAKVHPNKNVITRAIGTSKHVVADYFEVQLKPGDRILLCSDGLSNMLEDREMRYIMNRYSNDTARAVEELVKKANINGGKDNISAVLVQI